MSALHIPLPERLEVFAFMASMALSCGLLMLISAQEGKRGRAWAWAGAFVATSLLADWLFWGLA